MQLTENELDAIAKKLGVDQFAPVDMKDDQSLFGIKDSNTIKVNEKELADVDGIEWNKHNQPLETPTFYSSQKG